MTNNTNNIIAKSLKVVFKADNNIDYLNIYPIDSNECHDIITDVVVLIDTKGIHDFKVELSQPFIIEAQRAFTKDDVIGDLTGRISSALGEDNALKLTK